MSIVQYLKYKQSFLFVDISNSICDKYHQGYNLIFLSWVHFKHCQYIWYLDTYLLTQKVRLDTISTTYTVTSKI